MLAIKFVAGGVFSFFLQFMTPQKENNLPVLLDFLMFARFFNFSLEESLEKM